MNVGAFRDWLAIVGALALLAGCTVGPDFVQPNSHLPEQSFLGDNGTGKTTVLQAVALCLSLASLRTRSVREFDWLGWVPGRYERWGRPVVKLEVHFSDEEIEATIEAAQRWFKSHKGQGQEREFVEPGRSRSSRAVRFFSTASRPT